MTGPLVADGNERALFEPLLIAVSPEDGGAGSTVMPEAAVIGSLTGIGCEKKRG
jgi:hypothetical protein